MSRRMPIRRLRRDLAGASLALLALGACVPRAAPPAAFPTPASAPAPRPVPPAPRPAPAPPPADWATGPVSPGDWEYAMSSSTPGAIFRSTGLVFAIVCRDREIALDLSGAQGPLVIHTSYGERRLTTGRMPASDPLLDQMAFSRGRFLVRAEGGPSLVVPAWPEFARVIEDCRGQ
jgi:hypothetical protein